MTVRQAAGARTPLAWYQRRVRYTPASLGINYPWMNIGGSASGNWLPTYQPAVAEAGLALIASWGVTVIRAWCQIESVMSWNGSAYSWQGAYQGNLDDFLTRAANHGISVIVVISAGNASGYANLDGNFRWTFVTGSATPWLNALTAYVEYFSAHRNILMWELMNEPYANLTWSANAIASGATQTQVHAFLVAGYQAAKPLAGSTYVGFSDYESEQQAVYQMFSTPANVASLVDDCTDVYSMHIYRGYESQVADFRHLTGKPKWCSELGSYNYTGGPPAFPTTGYSEVTDDGPNGFSGLANPYSVRSIASALSAMGFSLIIPWAAFANNSVVQVRSNGTFLLGSLPAWMQGQFTARLQRAGPPVTVTGTTLPGRAVPGWMRPGGSA